MNKEKLLASLPVIFESSHGVQSFYSLLKSLAIRGKLNVDCLENCSVDQLISDLKIHKNQYIDDRGLRVKRNDSANEISTLGFELPTKWGLVPLREICFAQAGFAFSASLFNSNKAGLPLIRIRDIDRGFSETYYSGEYRPEFLVKKGDWLIGMDGNFSVRQWQGETALLNQRVTRLHFFDDRINQSFVSMALEEHLHSLMGTKSYTTVDHLSTKQIEAAPIPLPCLKEQNFVISRMSELKIDLDKLREKQNFLRNLNLAVRKSALDAISTARSEEDFQTAWKRIEENWDAIVDSQSSIKDLRALILNLAIKGRVTSVITKNDSAAKELASVKKTEVRELFKGRDSESDVYPKNWAVASFPNIGQWVAGSGFPTDEQGHTDKEILFCKVSDMNLPANSRHLVEANNTIDSATAKKLRATILKEGTVVFPKIGGAIATNKRRLIVKPTIVDNNCMGITPCSVIDSEWLFILLSSIDFVKYQSGTSIPSISQRTLDQIEFGVPPLNEQKMIVEKVSQLMKICDELENRILDKDNIAENFAKSIVAASA